MSVDVSGVDNLTSSSSGSTSLTGLKSAVDNLNSGKADVAGQVFTGNISAPNLSGTNTGDQTLPTDATLSTSDVTTNNVSSTKHGFAPKSPADATKFLNGDTTPGYAQVKDSDLSTTDITTNDVSTSKHGFVPKAPNDTAKFLRGDATWSAVTPSQYAVTSSSLQYSADAVESTSSTSYVLLKNIQIMLPGTIRVDFDIKASGGAFADGQVYINGVAAGSNQQTNSTTYVTHSDTTLYVKAGDQIQLYVKTENGSFAASCQNFRLYFTPTTLVNAVVITN